MPRLAINSCGCKFCKLTSSRDDRHIANFAKRLHRSCDAINCGVMAARYCATEPIDKCPLGLMDDRQWKISKLERRNEICKSLR
jgi:hypothetical protein